MFEESIFNNFLVEMWIVDTDQNYIITGEKPVQKSEK